MFRYVGLSFGQESGSTLNVQGLLSQPFGTIPRTNSHKQLSLLGSSTTEAHSISVLACLSWTLLHHLPTPQTACLASLVASFLFLVLLRCTGFARSSRPFERNPAGRSVTGVKAGIAVAVPAFCSVHCPKSFAFRLGMSSVLLLSA